MPASLNPFNLNSRLEYIKVLLQLNKKQQAKKVFEGALGRRYYASYKDAVYYLQLFLTLLSEPEDKDSIENLKQQIDELLEKKGGKGRYTLKNI